MLAIPADELERRMSELKRRSLRPQPHCITISELQRWPHLQLDRVAHVQKCAACQLMTSPSWRTAGERSLWKRVGRFFKNLFARHP